MTLGLLLATGVAALADWFAVAQRRFRLEYVLKPLTLLLLLLAAATADLGRGQTWLVVGLGFGLAGDIALMFSEADRTDPPFLLGLVSFALGHVCYLVAFLRSGVHGLFLLAGLLVVGGVAALALPQVLHGARRRGGRTLELAVGGYGALLAAMVVCAVGTGAALTAVGGVLFLGSDTVLGYDRFVVTLLRAPLLVIVSYHLGQLLIVLGRLR